MSGSNGGRISRRGNNLSKRKSFLDYHPYVFSEIYHSQQQQQQKEEGEEESYNSSFFDNLKGLPFFRWEDWHTKPQPKGSRCCFTCEIGWPVKNGVMHAIYDYEKEIIDALEDRSDPSKSKHVWIKKARGLGVTELVLRMMIWIAVRDDAAKNSHMCVITGPNIELATELIDRIQQLFHYGVKFERATNTILKIRGVTIRAYPSNHLAAMRGIPVVSFIFLDEAAYFGKKEQEEIRPLIDPYIPKSNPYLVVCSTPNTPWDWYASIESEKEDHTLFKRMFLYYTRGLGKIYTESEISQAQKSPSFKREYELQYLGELGNVFAESDIQKCIEYGKRVNYLDPPLTDDVVMGLDPSWGSSKFGIVIGQLYSSKIEIIYVEEVATSRPSRMIEVIKTLVDQYNIQSIYVDASGQNVGFVGDLKEMIYGEDSVKESWQEQLEKCKKFGYNPRDYMQVVPVVFTKESSAEMLAHSQNIVSSGYLAVPEHFENLIVQMRVSKSRDGRLDKTMYGLDAFDALRVMLKHFHLKTRQKNV